MMPLNLADAGTENMIKKIGGSPEVKKHLENLGIRCRRYCNSHRHGSRKPDCKRQGGQSCHQ